MTPHPTPEPPQGYGPQEAFVPVTDYPGISLGKCTVDLTTGEITDTPAPTGDEELRVRLREFRDIVLNDRDEMECTLSSEQTNAVLAAFDRLFPNP